MTERDRDRLYLDHIVECIRNVQADVAGDSATIVRSRTHRDAVIRNLQVMAESTQRLSDTIKASEPGIPWFQIEGFRHRLVHDYFRIDEKLIMRVIDEHVPELLAAVMRMRSAL